MGGPSLLGSAVVPLRLVFFMWLSFTLEFFYQWNIGMFGIVPRTIPGIVGIFTAPIIHGNIYHLISNTFPLLFLGTVLYYFYQSIASIVFYRAYFWTNILVWLFAWPGHSHIGASGVVYALAFFLIFFGIFYRDFRSLFISVVVFLMYGGIFYGVLPTDPGVSWESHLAGALVGIATAINLSKKRIR